MSAKALCFLGCPSAAFVRPGQVLLPRYLTNALNNFFYKTDREYLLLSDDLLDSGVKGQGRSRPWRWRRHPRGRWGVEFRLLVEYNMI